MLYSSSTLSNSDQTLVKSLLEHGSKISFKRKTLEPPAQSADIVLSLFSFFLSPLSPWCVLSSSLPPSAPHPPHPPKPLSPQSPSLVCMYVCMHAYMYVCNVCMYVCKYVCMYVCMYLCMHVCMYVFMYVCM